MPRKYRAENKRVLQREESPPSEPTPPAAGDPTVEEDEIVPEMEQAETAEDDTSQPKSKKSRILSNLDDEEQETVALFLERNDYIYNKKRKDHTFVSKKNKAWEELAQEMGLEVKALMTFFESSRTQIGKLRKNTSGQAPIEMTDRQQWIWTRFQFLVPHWTSNSPHSPGTK